MRQAQKTPGKKSNAVGYTVTLLMWEIDAIVYPREGENHFSVGELPWADANRCSAQRAPWLRLALLRSTRDGVPCDDMLTMLSSD